MGAAIVCGLLGGAALASRDRTGALTPIILLASVLGGLFYDGDAVVTEIVPSVVMIAIAAALLGPLTAGVAAILTELCVAIRFRTALTIELAVNLPACVAPAVTEGIFIHSFAWPPASSAWFYTAVAISGAIGYVLSFLVLLGTASLHGTKGRGATLQSFIDPLPSTAISLALGVAGVGIELEIGTGGIAFALAAVIAFSYMTHLLRESRHRAEQYASLSWGVLAGLLRSLDIRDERTARHSAAVARFSRDIAAAVGMDAAACELAHAAGLLHDIGRFALSDRVFERGRPLADEDWEAIQRHPELGADMLRDLGMYGPVAEIVLCHHERIDGLGYPRRLRAEEIPEIAKIIAVAEVYDTLTASDTYRTRQSSFEALTELRRVSGSQLDGRYVEVLASLLTGEGVEYRHADAVDFDEELGIEQIIKQAGTGR
ncbi:MAG TPA: HD domain-containing phosphohydrolase [Solirubrobacteraceae bacterium]|nr:HD domain-containing phosphohydrolase [Solirubrobacteraceae bacterium]